MLKPSRYNFIANISEETFLLCNGITGALYEIEAHEKNEITNLLKSDEISEMLYPREMLVRLLLGGIILPAGVDEVKIILDRAANECENHRTLELTVVPTYSCNFRCVYCDNDFQAGTMSEQVERSISAFVTKAISIYDHVNLSWYGGEPLLRKETINRLTRDIKEICEINGKTADSFIATNGYLLDRESASRLLSSGVTHFHITIDGAGQFHDRLRVLNGGGATYNTILDNLISLLDNEPSAKVTLRMNVNKNNINSPCELMSAIPAAHRKRVKLSLAPIISDGYKADPCFLMKINSITRKGLEMGFQCQNSTISSRSATPCHADKRGNFQVTPDGRLFKCTPSHDNQEAEIGRLGEDGAPIYNKNYKIWNDAPLIRDQCIDCKFLCFCKGGCRMARLHNVIGDSCKVKYSDIENVIINKYISLLPQ